MFKRNTLKRLIDFLNKLGVNNLVASINNVVTKITDLTGWQKFLASIGIGAIAKYVIDKMSGLAPDTIKDFIVSYLSENGLQTLITKLASFNAFVGWIQPIIKGVEMLYEVMKSSIETFLFDSTPFTHRLNLIRREGLDEEKRAALKSAIKAYAREIMMSEENVTGSGATFNAGYGENYATPYAFGKKKGDNRAVKFLKKMGWTVADLTLPKNSKMFDYKKIYEMKLNDIIEQGVLNEVSYGKFKKEVTYRTKSEQLHKAIREVKRKLQEIDRIVEYTSRMKQELSEDEGGISYWKATQKNVASISEMVNQLNNKIKNLNQ